MNERIERFEGSFFFIFTFEVNIHDTQNTKARSVSFPMNEKDLPEKKFSKIFRLHAFFYVINVYFFSPSKK
jgi:hypothetical protein